MWMNEVTKTWLDQLRHWRTEYFQLHVVQLGKWDYRQEPSSSTIFSPRFARVNLDLPTHVAGWSWHRVDTLCFPCHGNEPIQVKPTDFTFSISGAHKNKGKKFPKQYWLPHFCCLVAFVGFCRTRTTRISYSCLLSLVNWLFLQKPVKSGNLNHLKKLF